MRNYGWAALAVCAGLACSPCAATPTAKAWHRIAIADSDAALALIETSHPGASPALGDRVFQTRLKIAKAHVAARLPKITDYPSYAALMAGLAADFRDGHIWSNAIVGSQRVNTAGMLLIRQNGHWVVGVHQPADGEPDLKNAVLLGCDDRDADAWALPRIAAFRGDPDLEAVRIEAAGWLLLDEGNPFLVRPTRCRFAMPGTPPQNVTLRWRPTLKSGVQAAIRTVTKVGNAGMKVDAFAGGWWIGLRTLDDSAQKIVDLVKTHQAALRAAPKVVIDLRGNGGGDSRYADTIARLLVGDDRFAASRVSLPTCSGDYWRVSPGTLAALRSDLKHADADHDTAGASDDCTVIADMTAAIATHRVFSPALPACARDTVAVDQDRAPGSLPRSEMTGRLILITDHLCFSSCLIATNSFRRLGALHVGEATDRSTRYMEVREETLPSGLRAFSTLQKVAVGLGDYGPYTPAIPYPGALGDDAALQAWVTTLPAG